MPPPAHGPIMGSDLEPEEEFDGAAPTLDMKPRVPIPRWLGRVRSEPMPDSPPDDPLELAILGGFVFSVGGDALLGISVGSQRLLAFLAVRDRVTTRNLVAGTLWPESSDDRAGASLRSAISRLEGATRGAVRVTAHDLRLDDGVAVDVHRSEDLAHRLIDPESLSPETDISRNAVVALSDDLLPGWYDDWAVIAAEDWHQLRIHALEAVAARLTAADRLAEAAAAALTAVQAEPLRESARAALIRVHLAEGNQSEAAGEFERYRVLLRAELDIEPTSRLVRLLSGPPNVPPGS
jgi:SARP family transcriptional regulator, regulator of embCAB operon